MSEKKTTSATDAAIKACDYKGLGAVLGALAREKLKKEDVVVLSTALCLDVIYPHGVGNKQYAEMLSIAHIIEHLCRVSKGNPEAWDDIAVESLLMIMSRGGC
ncbi:MAG: hypothetical protein ACYTBJ_01230 [Planctomycetota bacterium]|jgi:hypothetical protein